MKQGRKPTLEEKKLMAENGMDWKAWSVLFATTNGIEVISKRTGEKKILRKEKA